MARKRPPPECRECKGARPSGHTYCLPCGESRRKQSKRRWKDGNPEHRRAWEKKARQQMGYAYRRKYGMTLQDVETLRQSQNGICAIPICTSPATRIDHCHETGVVRGMLCHRCNLLLAGLERPDWAESARTYLEGGGTRWRSPSTERAA